MFLFFEVMDKEPALPQIWGIFLFLGIAGFFLARKNPFFLALLLPLIFVISCVRYLELSDPFVGPDIIREAGYGYVVQSYLAMGTGVLLPLAGVVTWAIRRKRKPLQ